MKRFCLKSVLLFFCLFAGINAFAQDFVVDGIGYIINSYFGDEVSVAGLSGNDVYSGSVVIPESVTVSYDEHYMKTYRVTGIGHNAFNNCSGLTSVIIPNSVTRIESWAFRYCTGLTSITIPDGVTFIGSEAFGGCSNLASIYIPESVTEIGGIVSAFWGTPWFDNQPDGLVYAGNVAYFYKGDMPENAHIEIKEGTVRIESYAFYGRKGLISVTIPESVASIGTYAFNGCSGLTSISIPENVNCIGGGAFLGTPWYDNQPNGLVYAGKVLYGYKGDMPENTHIEIKQGTLGIVEGAFAGCSGMTSIILPGSVTNIGSNAFRDCSGLTSITIPESMTKIDSLAFRGCTSLETLIYAEGTKTVVQADIPYITSVIIPNSVTSIGYRAFHGCGCLTSVNIPENVTSIGTLAFCGCSSLVSAPLGNNVKSIGFLAFGGCDMSSITIPESVTNIDDRAFEGCYFAKDAFINNSALASDYNWGATLCDEETDDGMLIKGDTIVNCRTWATSVTIPESITTIGGNGFYGCHNLISITIPESVTSILGKGLHGTPWYDNQPDGLVYAGKVAYSYKGTMPEKTHIVIEQGTLGIAAYAFSFCNGLTSITIPESMKNIDGYAFYSCDNLNNVIIESDSIVSRNSYSLMRSLFGNQVKEYVIGNSVKSIGNGVFYNCSGLTSVIIGSAVTSIGTNAFYGCSGLMSVTSYAMEPPTLKGNVFTNVPKDMVVSVPAAAIEQYQGAAGWKNFFLRPVQEDLREIIVYLPESTNTQDFAQMWLELTNTKSGQRMHYVMTDRTQYTFPNIDQNSSWNVVLRNERGDVFGLIDNVEVKDEDVSVTFTSLSKPQNVTLSVLTPDGQDVTNQAQITWNDAQGNYMAQGTSLSGLPVGYQANYSIVLSQELAMVYETPLAAEYMLKDGGNGIVCQLDSIPQVQLYGRVKDAETGLPLSESVISVSQTFGGKYTKTLTAKTDKDGKFTIEVAAVPTSLTFAAADYVSQSINLEDEMHELHEYQIPDVSLMPITGAAITVDFTYTTVDGETQDWYSDYQNVAYTLYNITREKPISQFNVQYPQIVLLEEVEDGDVLKLTASSRTTNYTNSTNVGAFMPVTTTTTIAEQKAEASFAIMELGQIQATFVKNGNAAVVGSLYDASGKLVNTYNYANASLTVSNLADGQYTLVSMGSSQLYNTIYDLAQLPQTGLVDGTDYIKNTVEVQSGAISTIAIEEVPTLDESKLYYTGDNTSFTVNKSDIVVGNYIALTGHIDFKPDYASNVSNVQMIVDLPESCQFVENSVMVGNSISSYFTLNDSQITVPLTYYTDRVLLCIIPTHGGEYAPSAFVQFDLGGKTIRQPIGSANYIVKDLSINIPPTVAKTSVPISGTAIGVSNVEVYDNDVLIGQTTSLANGTWQVTCDLNEPYNLSKHSIYAKVTTKAGLELQSETIECMYDMNAVVPKTVTMITPNSQTIVFDYQNMKTNLSGYSAISGSFTFVVDFTNNDSSIVNNVFVNVFTDKNEVKQIIAEYNDKKDKWVAVSKFSSDNQPVNVSVNYNAKTETILDATEVKVILTDFENLQNNVKESEEKLDSMFQKLDELESEKKLDSETIYAILNNVSEHLGLDTPAINVEETMDSLDFVNLINEVDILLEQNEAKVFDNFADVDIRNISEELAVYIKGITVTDCMGLDSLILIQEGYEAIPQSDGTSFFVKADGGLYSFVDFNNRIVLSVNANEADPELAKGLMHAHANSDFGARMEGYCKTFRKWINKFRDRLIDLSKVADKGCELLEDLLSDAIVRRDILSQEWVSLAMKELDTPLTPWEAFCRNVSMVKWMALSQKVDKLEKALAYLKQLKVGRVIGGGFSLWSLVDHYTTMLDDMEGMISLYYSIPDCPDTQSGEPLRNKVASFGIGAGIYYVAVITSDAAALATAIVGVSSATVTLGSSLVAVGLAIAKVGATWYASKSYKKNYAKLVDEINEDIAKMNCDTIPPPAPPLPPTPTVNPIYDPSGFVYEGVPSNRLQGVTATVYYKEMIEDMCGDQHENIVKWDAVEYGQENPLFTDEYGMYAWDVPQGLWQVKFEKEGYETTYSEWLPVPPPQLDVNIAMKQARQPEVKDAHAYEDAVEVEFDKYMLPALLTTENISVIQGGNAVEGTIELLNEEAADESDSKSASTETFASKVRFNAAQPFTAGEVTLVVANRVRSYADVPMQDDYQQTFTIEKEVKEIVADSLVDVLYGDTETITVQVLPVDAAAGKTLTVKTSSPMILGVNAEHVVIGEDGKAKVTVFGELPGTAALTFSVEGTDKTATTIVGVEQTLYVAVAAPTASIASGTTVTIGTRVTLSCETEGAIIYYTTDGSCPCDENGSRMVYDGTPIIITEAVTIKAMAVVPDVGESDVAEFVYTVKGVGMEEVVLGDEIQVWPIPVRDKLNVTAGGKTIKCVTVSSMSGVGVASSNKAATTVTLDVAKLPAGIYIVGVTTEAGNYSRKILKVQ